MRFIPKELNPLHLANLVRGSLVGEKKPPAQPPGTLVHIGQKKTDSLQISVVEFDAESVEVLETADVGKTLRFVNTSKVTWIHVTGLHESDKVAKLGSDVFKVHPLILEDVLNTTSRPKIEDFDDYVFVVAKSLFFDESASSVDVQHFGLILLPNSTLITFLEAPSPVFDPVRKRIETGGGGRIRKAGADYLAWALLDSIVDHYFGVIDGVDEALTTLDERLQDNPDSVEASDLYTMKKEVTSLHRLVRPIREIGTVLYRSNSRLITEYSQPFFRDLFDHAIHVIESTDDLRESAAALRDFFLAAVSNRMNEIMKVLTCFATIFLPLTFFAGIYGMNFEVMPELKLSWAYPALWAVFIVSAGGMFIYFRRRRWL